MSKISMIAVASLLMATPALAQLPYGSDEPQSQIQWQQLVDQANAYRTSHTERAVAAVKASVATDAAVATVAPKVTSLGLSSDPEIRQNQEWELLVAKLNASRR